MPPFINTNCIHCKKTNRFDLAELGKKDGSITKGLSFRDEDEYAVEEFVVTCNYCRRKFKFAVKGGGDGKEK